MRVRLKGLAKVKYKLASGKIQEYYYAWRGGPLIKHDDGRPMHPSEPEFIPAFSAAHNNRPTYADGLLRALIIDYKKSSDFTKKADKTQKEYNRYMAMIDEEFGDMPLSVVEDQRSRGIFKEWRDTMADRPRTADYAWTTLARILSFAKDRGRIKVNVCEKGGRLYSANRAEKIWSNVDVDNFMAKAPAHLQLAITLALWTGQRQGDLLSALWTAYDGQYLRVQQSKTGARVIIPIGQPLKITLDASKREAETILCNTRGKAWTDDGFRTSWGRVAKQAGISDLTFHDLRGTAVTRLAIAGCTTSQIAAITGHSLKDVQTILDTHYLGGQLDLAAIAISKLEALNNL